ncbi:hypothetical protein KKA09_03715 [Patescibacteria group bacterium]|nr:hypothetical protein [Patescibacteria group bacterium]
MSNKVFSADNQQGRPDIRRDPSETTRRTPLSDEEIRAYFLGALHDGTFSSNKRYRICQKNIEWLKFLKELLKNIGYNSWIYKEGKNRNVYILETLASFMNFKFNPFKIKTEKEKIAYVKGFFDAEGGIPKNPKDRFYIQLCQKDKGKIMKLKKILENLGIKTGKTHNPSVNKNPYYWRLYVSAESHKDFIRLIGSYHPDKMKLLDKRMKI